MTKKKALIAGATGVVGRNLLRHLLATGEWDIVALSRRTPDVEGVYEHIAVDDLRQAFSDHGASSKDPNDKTMSFLMCCHASSLLMLLQTTARSKTHRWRLGYAPCLSPTCIYRWCVVTI